MSVLVSNPRPANVVTNVTITRYWTAEHMLKLCQEYLLRYARTKKGES